jgi:cytochrome c oxidase subunit 4
VAGHVHHKIFYVKVFASLIALTIITTVVAYVDLGSTLNTIVALAIACCKASLVVLFFMHLNEQTGMTRVVILAALLFLAVLIGITMSDVFTRRWNPSGGSWERSAVVEPAPSRAAAAVSDRCLVL